MFYKSCLCHSPLKSSSSWWQMIAAWPSWDKHCKSSFSFLQVLLWFPTANDFWSLQKLQHQAPSHHSLPQNTPTSLSTLFFIHIPLPAFMAPFRPFLPTLLSHLSVKRHQPDLCSARNLLDYIWGPILHIIVFKQHYPSPTTLVQHWTLQSELCTTSCSFHRFPSFQNTKLTNPARTPGPLCMQLNRISQSFTLCSTQPKSRLQLRSQLVHPWLRRCAPGGVQHGAAVP